MISIDGSYGEGGGQILRTSIAMSMITRIPIKVDNIRANRSNPGLSHQHYKAIEAAADICDADTSGLKKRSEQITFEPGAVAGGDYEFDIGTAGSVTLLLQALLPPAVSSKDDFTFTVKGGTDVKWSPPYDYFDNVFLSLLNRMGVEIESGLIKRGHYPKGGGKIKVQVKGDGLDDLEVGEKIDGINGIAFVTNLPDHISERMKKSAENILDGYDVNISTGSYSSPSAGTGITLWTEGRRVLGSGVLGEKGTPAEEVGEDAAETLKEGVRNGAELDKWCADQLVPYLSLMDDSGKIKIDEKTGHLETNIWVVDQFVDKQLSIDEGEELYLVY